MENVKEMNYNKEAVEQDYRETWMPHIHNIGQVTLIIGYAMMFIPSLFMYFVCRWNEIPFSVFVGFFSFILPLVSVSLAVEHLQYYPMCGATTIYIAYLAGNLAAMRLPVAQSCAAASGDDVMSAKGQVAATVGVAVSVVANIVILLLIVVFGNFVLGIIPAAVRSALGLITYAIFGYLLVSNIFGAGRGNFLTGLRENWYWAPVSILTALFFQKVFPWGRSLYILWTLLAILAFSMALEKMKEKKAA